MGGWAGAIRGGLAGLNEAAGNPRIAQQLEAQNNAERDNRLQLQIAPLSASLRADMQRLTNYVDANGNPLPQHKADYDLVRDHMANTIGQIRSLYHQKPSVNPLEAGVGNLLDKLHITNHLKNHVANVRAANAKKYQDQNSAAAGAYAAGALPYSMTPEGQKAEYAQQTAIAVANARGTMREYQSPDGKERNWFRPGSEPPGWNATQSGGNSSTRQSYHLVTPQDAISLMRSVGQVYPKSDGTNWTEEEIAKFPKGTVLQQYFRGDKAYYEPVDQRTKTASIGNMVVQLPEAGQITPDTENPVGVARVPTVTTHQVPGMNPGETVTLTTRVTPQTTGPSSMSPASAPPKPKGGAMGTRPVSGPVHRSLQMKASMANGEMPPEPAPFAHGTFLTQGKTVQPVVASMRVVGAQVFGGNGQPPIWKYSHFYDDPDMARALNKALTMNSLTMPGVRSDPGFWETLATAAGVTGWSQEQINRAAVDARSEVQKLGGEDAMRFLSRLMGFQEDLAALRTATRASSAQGSIQTLVRAAPIYNVSSGQNFRDQLATTLNTAAAAMSGYPVINPQFVDWFALGARMAQGGDESKKPIVQHSPSTGKYRYSTDGGKTWQPGQPPA